MKQPVPSKTGAPRREFQADRMTAYFRVEWKVLLIVVISGLLYNFGLLAGPWFEGKMTGYLVTVLRGSGTFAHMLGLVCAYVAVIGFVQVSRYVKRFYVRRFANNVNRRMKEILYAGLVRTDRETLRREGEGSLMTKAILDVDDCVEGMRKFTTEVFDTGVAMVAYLGMLLWYDWRLALICLLFQPISYFAAEKMKKLVQRTGAAFKVQSAKLSTATLDRAENAVTYRVFGLEKARQEAYEENLASYEAAAVRANIWGGAMPPLYQIISMAGALFILWFGQKNVLGTGWQLWTIAEFTTFLSCYTKLSTKTSKAGKLFNAVHKAQVSWNRIQPLLGRRIEDDATSGAVPEAERLTVSHLSFAYPDGQAILKDISFTAKKGQIIGITGSVACGKSTLGKVFLCETPYEGKICVDGQEIRTLSPAVRRQLFGYLGHDPELFQDSVTNNILLGDDENPQEYLKMVAMDQEVSEMEDGAETLVGSSGVRLSGGQAKRLALARTLCHNTPILILDDPFSALDKATERQVFENLKAQAQNQIILLLSHRLYLFPQLAQVLWMEGGHVLTGTHETLLEQVPEYRRIEQAQQSAEAEKDGRQEV